MSDKTVTEREAVKRERAAFVEGRHAGYGCVRPHCEFTDEANARYPIPTRPRIARDPHDGFEWSVRGGTIVQRTALGLGGEWYGLNDGYRERYNPTPKRVVVWADLFANPTEECDADD